jgi:N-formylglutamate amidohydrolase
VNAPGPPALVVHIPHASLVVPDDVAADLLLTPEQLEHELLVMTDRYTDALFGLPSSLATTVVFPVSRVVVDPERFADDACEPMVGKGMGVLYTRSATGHPLRIHCTAPVLDVKSRRVQIRVRGRTVNSQQASQARPTPAGP